MSNEYIEKQNQVYRIKGTRVALDSIIYRFQEGRSPESIQDSFPALSLSQVYAAIAYYLDHQAELDSYLAHNEATEAEFSREIARLFPKGAALKARIKQTVKQSLPEPSR
jgi:uncharacterized protein (DUF433 family)